MHLVPRARPTQHSKPAPAVVVEEIDQMLGEGYTLPAEFYTDDSIAELEDYWIFQRAWKPMGLVQELSDTGSFVTGMVGTIPVLVVRGTDGTLRAFINICRHRGHTVAQGCGSRKSLQCPYHGWTYDLTGRLINMPRIEEGDVDLADFPLAPASVDTFGGVVWASVAPRESLAEFLGEFPRLGESLGLVYPFELYDDWVRVPPSTDRRQHSRPHRVGPFHYHSNWKITVENNIECYHCPKMHAFSFSKLYRTDPTGYSITDFDRGTCQLANHTGHWAGTHGGGAQHKRSAEAADFKFLFLFPNGAGSGARGGIFAPDGVTEMRLETGVLPLRVDESLLITGSYYRRRGADPSRESDDDEVTQLLQMTFEEDMRACASIQANLRTGKIRYGKTMPQSESSVRHFQRLWWDALKPGFEASLA